nr:immunoglobulin light chain junction region [Macaca mulatta]
DYFCSSYTVFDTILF